ncbi:ThiF family adenylyltransferase [Thauera sp. 2A1]|uniref:ThiF family adenylyltransferase n=1 Tax=Thauera sp. 2A1 TaxID=2570191 RepID=UPI001290EB93
MNFDYSEAFSRNIGWVTRPEQETLRGKRVAIAGMGGVGGWHLLTLVRLGVGKFTLADFDTFGLVNFNRQAGAMMNSLGRPKLDVMVEQALAVNPELDIRRFPAGTNPDNVSDFLDSADLYIDSLDFFALDAREAVFARCAKLGIPATTVAPLGMGAALLNFLPGEMTFEEYFGFAGQDELERALRFFIGLAPARLQMAYLADPSNIDLAARHGASTIMGCMLCAGVAGTEAVKILLGRGKVLPAPWSVHYDAYLNRLSRLHRPGGNAHPRQRRTLDQARRALGLV